MLYAMRKRYIDVISVIIKVTTLLQRVLSLKIAQEMIIVSCYYY